MTNMDINSSLKAFKTYISTKDSSVVVRLQFLNEFKETAKDKQLCKLNKFINIILSLASLNVTGRERFNLLNIKYLNKDI